MMPYTCLHIFNLQMGKGEEMGVWSSSDIGKYKSLASSVCQNNTNILDDYKFIVECIHTHKYM